MIRRIGKKTREWMEAKPGIVKEYQEQGIMSCEGVRHSAKCNPFWALSIHHLDKRSTGRARHTFEDTRLLCPSCHDLAEHNNDFNDLLRELR